MKLIKLGLLAGGITLALACEDGGKDLETDTDIVDTANPSEPTPTPLEVLITNIDPAGCNAGGTAFEYGILTQGWADGGAVLSIFDTSFDPAFDEEHPMDHGAFDPNDDSFDVYDVTLVDETAFGTTVAGESTIFNCDNEAFLTFAIEIFDGAGNQVDCAVFGHNPDEIIDGTWPDGGEDNTNNTIIGDRFSACLDWNQ